MDSYRQGATGIAIAAAAILLTFVALPARAEAPGGSYLQTCTHVRSSGDRVTADCRRVDGSWNHAELGNADTCVGGIANMNGQLTCNRARRDYGEMRRHYEGDRSDRWNRSDRWDQGSGSSRRFDHDFNGR